MDTANVVEYYQHNFRELAPTLPAGESVRVHNLRQSAMARFAALGFPNTSNEAWKYTRLTGFERQRFTVATKKEMLLDQAVAHGLAQTEDLPGYKLVFVDGYYAPQFSSGDRLPEGVSFVSLGTALAREDETVIAALERACARASDGFAALNLAYLSDGVSLRLAKNTQIQEPINLIFINQGRKDRGAHVHNLLSLEAGSRASIAETYIGLGDDNYFSNHHSEVVLGDNAHLDFYSLQQQGDSASHIAALNIVQYRDSRFAYHGLSLGGQLARHGVESLLNGEGADCVINALLMGKGRQHIDLHSRIDHVFPRGTSREYVRGILDERARGVLDGMIVVQPHAQKTDARLVSNNLLLSQYAEMDVKPQLEIYADDVKCSHGATVGQLEDDALFYLRSRGLDEATASALMTYAFAADILGRMPVEGLRACFQRRLLARMPQAVPVKELL